MCLDRAVKFIAPNDLADPDVLLLTIASGQIALPRHARLNQSHLDVGKTRIAEVQFKTREEM